MACAFSVPHLWSKIQSIRLLRSCARLAGCHRPAQRRPMTWSSLQQGFWSVPFRVLPCPSSLRVKLLIVNLEAIRAPELEQALGLQGTRFSQQIYELKRQQCASGGAGTRVGVSGTPTFFINRRLLVGAPSFETFQAIIDQEPAMHGRQSMGKN